LCPEFRHLVSGAVLQNKVVIDRCNLTALLEPGQEDTGKFLADHGVQVVASLPCYSAKNVNLQRGSGVFQRSVKALLLLNELGYGKSGSGLRLDLVYNPLGAFLPPNQSDLETKYKAELWEEFGIEFNSLFTMTNMPIKRFADFLTRRNELDNYMDLLVRNFNPRTLDTVMCRNVISINYDGSIFDCDFNQQLALPLNGSQICLSELH
jgi:radical SAM/Cys-rich protein